MAKSFLRCCCVFLILAVSPLFAATASQDLAQLLNKIQAMQADFTQTIYDNKQKPIQTSTGKMAIVRPGKFRWEVDKPIAQLIIANGEKLWIYDPDLEQVTIRSIKSITGNVPAFFLSQAVSNLDQDFSVSNDEKAGGLDWYTLHPKQPDDMFTVIKLGFSNGQLQAMELDDNLGHSTQIKYKQIASNSAVSPNLFTFKPPRGVDVIDETKRH